MEKADLEIDNKALRKQINNTADNLREEIELKRLGFDVCKNGFELKELLDARAKALIETNQPKPKKRKAKEVLVPDSIPHPELYSLLRSWRYEKSMELSVPAYRVFSQKALIELVNYLPTESKSLKLINGLGNKKIEQFGADIIQMIQHYCDQNTIEKMEIPLKEDSEKQKKPKSDTKKVSFDLFQSGKTIAEIAGERQYAVATIEGHLSHYVGLGKLDIGSFVEEDRLKKIMSYFKSTENKSLSEAKAALGDDFSYTELRFVAKHLEFLSN